MRIIFPGNRVQLVSNCNYCLSHALTIDLKWWFGDTGLSFTEPLLCDSLCCVAVLLLCPLKPFPVPVTNCLSKYHTRAARCDVQQESPQHLTRAEAVPALPMVQTLLRAKCWGEGAARSPCAQELVLPLEWPGAAVPWGHFFYNRQGLNIQKPQRP